MKQVTGFSLDGNVVAYLDSESKRCSMSRSAFLESIIRRHRKQMPPEDELLGAARRLILSARGTRPTEVPVCSPK